MPTADGFRIIVPIGERSEWARNVLAAGHCRLLLGDRLLELDEPVLETPADVPGLPRPVRALFEWLGFRYLRLRNLREPQIDALVPAIDTPPVELEAGPAGDRGVSVRAGKDTAPVAAGAVGTARS